MNPQRALRCVSEGYCDGSQNNILIRHFGRGDEINCARTLRFRTLLEREDSDKQSDRGYADQNDTRGRKRALGGAELLADVKLGNWRGKLTG